MGHRSRPPFGPATARKQSLQNETLSEVRKDNEVPETKRLYHFMHADYALQAIERRRLKAADLDKVNDPYESLTVGFNSREEEESFFEFHTYLANMFCLSHLQNSNSTSSVKLTDFDSWQFLALIRHRGACGASPRSQSGDDEASWSVNGRTSPVHPRRERAAPVTTG